MRALRVVILINAVATLAAGVVLFVVPAAIPATVGIDLAPDQRFIAWLLGAAEIAIAALCIGSVHSPHQPVLRLAAMTLMVFHAASGVADVMALTHQASAVVAANLVLRVIMIALLATFGLRLASQEAQGEQP
jgi:hypothetical protein